MRKEQTGTRGGNRVRSILVNYEVLFLEISQKARSLSLEIFKFDLCHPYTIVG